MVKKQLLKPLLFILIIISILAIANIGAWITYPQHFPKPHLIFVAYKQLFPHNLPASIKNSTTIAIIYFAITTKLFLLPKSNLKQKHKYGYARFAKFSELKKMGFNFKKGICLGKMNGKYIRTDMPYSTLVLAPPGTGKTSGIIIPTLLMCDNSMIIHDPKGELYEKTAQTRQNKLNQKILLFDPAHAKQSCCFNPFAKNMIPKNKENIRAYIETIASIIFNPKNKYTKEEYFIDAGRSAFVFFAEWLVWKNKETSIPQIRNKLLEEPEIDETIQIMLKEHKLPRYIKNDGAGVLVSSKSENQWAGVMGELREHLEPFGENGVAKVMSKNCDFQAEDFRNQKMSLYIKVRDKDRKRLKPVVSIVFELLGTGLISKMPKKEDNQVSFILDEFTRLDKMEIIADLPSISRSYNISSIFVAQDYEQISSVYGRDYISIFDSNCAYKVIFKQNNYFTAERISRLIGNRTVERVSNSKGKSVKASIGGNFGSANGNSANKSESVSQEGLPLVSTQDVLNLEWGEGLVVVQGFAGRVVRVELGDGEKISSNN